MNVIVFSLPCSLSYLMAVCSPFDVHCMHHAASVTFFVSRNGQFSGQDFDLEISSLMLLKFIILCARLFSQNVLYFGILNGCQKCTIIHKIMFKKWWKWYPAYGLHPKSDICQNKSQKLIIYAFLSQLVNFSSAAVLTKMLLKLQTPPSSPIFIVCKRLSNIFNFTMNFIFFFLVLKN